MTLRRDIDMTIALTTPLDNVSVTQRWCSAFIGHGTSHETVGETDGRHGRTL